jgi:hypothetical protein
MDGESRGTSRTADVALYTRQQQPREPRSRQQGDSSENDWYGMPGTCRKLLAITLEEQASHSAAIACLAGRNVDDGSTTPTATGIGHPMVEERRRADGKDQDLQDSQGSKDS